MHSVSLPNFKMMKSFITAGMWNSCVVGIGCSLPLCVNAQIEQWQETCWGRSYEYENDRLPVNHISWFQVMEFAAWVGARLPTDTEWKYAARSGGQNTIYPWGNDTVSCECTTCYECYN